MAISRIARVGVAVLAFLLLGAGIWYGVTEQRPPSAPGAAADTVGVTGGDQPMTDTTAPEEITPEVPPVKEDAQIADYALAFRKAGNYGQFIADSLAAAKAGNADAQYYIHAAMKYCATTYGLLKRGNGRILSVEEAIASWTEMGSQNLTEPLTRAGGRCRDVWGKSNASWGSADEWLARATHAGHPVAQSVTANDMHFKVMKSARQKENTGPYDPDKDYRDPELSDEELRDVRVMARNAAASKNPEAMAHLGELVWRFKPGKPSVDTDNEFWVWLYAACLRGLDCSAEAEWHKDMCVYDPECSLRQDGMDYLRQVASRIDLFNLEARAYAINDKIDRGDWEALGLASAGSDP